MSNIRQNLFFAFIYNVSAFPSPQACSIRSSDSPQPHARQRRNDLQLRVGDRQRAAAAADKALR